MRVVIYLRVSTGKQVEEGLGLEVQEHACRAWARQHGHQVAGVHRDEGISGTKDLADRDGLADALEAIEDGRAHGLLVYRLDRLARDAFLQEQLFQTIWTHGGEVLSTSPTEQDLRDDPEDPSRRMIRGMLALVAQYERDMIVLRLRRGRRRKHERGGYAYGAPRLGYHAADKKLVVDDGEQATVARILELSAAGGSLRAIAAELNAAGVPGKRGGRWHANTIARVLARADADLLTVTGAM